LIWFCIEIRILREESVESGILVGLFEIYWGEDEMGLICYDYSFNLDIIIKILIWEIDCKFIVRRVFIFDIDLSKFIDDDMIILFTEIVVFFSSFLFWFLLFLFNFFLRLFMRFFFYLFLRLFLLFMYFFLFKGIWMLWYFVPFFFGFNFLLFLDCLFNVVLDIVFFDFLFSWTNSHLLLI